MSVQKTSPESDVDRIGLVRTTDELTSHIRSCKNSAYRWRDHSYAGVQETLITVMAGVADPYNREYHINDDKTQLLEEEIDRMEGLFDRPKKFILPGGTRPFCRDRCGAHSCKKSGKGACICWREIRSEYSPRSMNRIESMCLQDGRTQKIAEKRRVQGQSRKTGKKVRSAWKNRNTSVSEAVIQEVMKHMGIQGRITLESAKRLSEKIKKKRCARERDYSHVQEMETRLLSM